MEFLWNNTICVSDASTYIQHRCLCLPGFPALDMLPMSLSDLLRNALIVNIHAIHEPSSLDAFFRHSNTVTVFSKQDIVSAHVSFSHLPSFTIESPILQTITPLPLHAVILVLIFIPELHSDFVVGKGEKLLAETIRLLLLPLLGQELDDLFSAAEEVIAVAPNAVGRVPIGDLFRVTCVPHILREFDLFSGRLEGVWRFERRHLGDTNGL